MRFFLGTHETSWLGKVSVPLFISRIRLEKRRHLPQARGPWALDSGGFTELNRGGHWSVSARQYVGQVRRWSEEIGNLVWAAAQDWMCEPFVLAKTGKTVQEHQELTAENFCELKRLAPELPWAPVLQGWEPEDYFAHLELYESFGVDLQQEALVGVGSVCRRQDTGPVERMLYELAASGLRLHGFGFKVKGLVRCAPALASADSLSWSYQARRNPGLPGCRHKRCANCLPYALRWRRRLLGKLEQPALF